MHRLTWPESAALRISKWLHITLLLTLTVWVTTGHCMTDDQISALQDDTRSLFYHGYHNYLSHAFPEDELRPISCKPQTRNQDNPADIGLNDVLGNYSVTLIDSLSTLAILASDADPEHATDALNEFKMGIRALVELYGDGTEKGRCGKRACGFDLDSKVQVFETNIRGVGGLLSAHLFAVGELPIRGYRPLWETDRRGNRGIDWNGFRYDGQLLRLAFDLAKRLLPAFSTDTGLPYPRVNLRHGVPFYQDAEQGVCRLDGTSTDPREITETCAAGAGSLVLEFTVLSRLTGDVRFENLAKRAFWAVWERRSPINLIGGGIDAESGEWIMPPLAGVGAGIDSFFEYAFKSHILLSGLPYNTSDTQLALYNAPESFLSAWQHAHAAIKRHVYRSSSTEKHPYYGQTDLITGAPRYNWIDNLSAYYSGLLTLAGELEEAIESHLVYAALWTRYSALPERWHVHNSFIDPNFKHWAGRPEFIESTFHLYQATKDPWYLHVGEMTLRDIRRRCWTRCGWADLGDVVNGEQRDRMESFFLGETAKYLYLLFTENHPLNKMDAPMVFTTEGHPLILPKATRQSTTSKQQAAMRKAGQQHSESRPATCPAPPKPLPLTVSTVANRADLFHAAALAQLHLVPVNPTQSSPLLEASQNGPSISIEDVRSPSNYTFYPWTLPRSLIPPRGMSSRIKNPVISTLTFPNLNPDPRSPEAERGLIPLGALQKVLDGIVINSLSNIRLSMVQEPKSLLLPNGQGVLVEAGDGDARLEFRIQGIANWALGRDEKVILNSEALKGVSPTDPHFTRVKDLEMVDLILDVPVLKVMADKSVDGELDATGEEEDIATEWDANITFEIPEDNSSTDGLWGEIENLLSGLLSTSSDSSSGEDTEHSTRITQPTMTRLFVPAILPTGPGVAPLPAAMESTSSSDLVGYSIGQLPYSSIFFLDSELCVPTRLPPQVAKTYQILVLKRGGCSFNEKLSNIPSFAPTSGGLQLVIMLSTLDNRSDTESPRDHGELIRPLLDEVQRTSSGFERRHPIAMVMVDGTTETVMAFRRASTARGSFDQNGRFVEDKVQRQANAMAARARQGVNVDNRNMKPGLAVKRRYWFESMGVPIGNLIML